MINSQASTGTINGSYLYDPANGKTVTGQLSDAEAGRIAKQGARDQQVAGQVTAAKDQEIGAMYGRLKNMLEVKQYENDRLKEYVGNGLAGQSALR